MSAHPFRRIDCRNIAKSDSGRDCEDKIEAEDLSPRPPAPSSPPVPNNFCDINWKCMTSCLMSAGMAYFEENLVVIIKGMSTYTSNYRPEMSLKLRRTRQPAIQRLAPTPKGITLPSQRRKELFLANSSFQLMQSIHGC